MKKKFSLHLLTIRILLAINISVVAGLWITGFFSGLNPEKWGWLSLMGYVFPFFIVTTIMFMAVWIFFKPKFILVSLAGLLIAYYPVTMYCPVNVQSSSTFPSTLKLMSYNVFNWGLGYTDEDYTMERNLTDEEKFHVMVDFFKSVDADIVAVQEGSLISGVDSLRNIYQYNDTVHSFGEQGCAALLLSKYPITHKENLHLLSQGNGAGAFWVMLPPRHGENHGKEIIVIAAHLQSMGFSVDEKERFRTMIHGESENNDSVRSTSKTIFGKILAASKKRAAQTDIIARFIEKHRPTPIIVMGDFNDIPQSYTHSVLSDYLNDCYHERGCGPGYSFSHFGMRVRIDNILCSDDFITLSCNIDKNINLSDHQPIIATVEMKD